MSRKNATQLLKKGVTEDSSLVDIVDDDEIPSVIAGIVIPRSSCIPKSNTNF